MRQLLLSPENSLEALIYLPLTRDLTVNRVFNYKKQGIYWK